ncbi:MAG: hypothetical protein GXP56_09845 [Deltaproteobacteria bacterium]|nr:hypothetical protein [Deltaproteobacteria bacterium]
MTHEFKTLELARTYESQGYLQDALEIYSSLNTGKAPDEVKAGLKRIEKRLKDKGKDTRKEENISRLFEKWLMLMVLKQRLDNFKKIKARLL